MNKIIGLLVLAFIFSFMTDAFSESADLSPEEKGYAIAQEMDRRDSGFHDSEEVFIMKIVDNRGNELIRRMRMRVLEQQKDGDWSMSIFDEPADVKGMALLTYTHGLDPDDQWLYMPALKRVKRIASNKKSGAFMGSEFSFEDFSANDLRKYQFKYLRDESFNGKKCTVLSFFLQHCKYRQQSFAKRDF